MRRAVASAVSAAPEVSPPVREQISAIIDAGELIVWSFGGGPNDAGEVAAAALVDCGRVDLARLIGYEERIGRAVLGFRCGPIELRPEADRVLLVKALDLALMWQEGQ